MTSVSSLDGTRGPHCGKQGRYSQGNSRGQRDLPSDAPSFIALWLVKSLRDHSLWVLNCYVGKSIHYGEECTTMVPKCKARQRTQGSLCKAGGSVMFLIVSPTPKWSSVLLVNYLPGCRQHILRWFNLFSNHFEGHIFHFLQIHLTLCLWMIT
jgi:hypothetical protein